MVKRSIVVAIILFMIGFFTIIYNMYLYPNLTMTGNTISVFSFGVKGNGVDNDTEALTKAINTLKDGDTLYIPKGEYLIEGLTISKSNIQIIADQDSVFLAKEKVYNFIEISGKNISIQGLTVDGNRNAQRGIGIIRYSQNIIIKNCTVRNIYDNKEAVEISAIKVYGDCKDILIDNCNIYNVEATPNGNIGDSMGAARGIIISPLISQDQGDSTNITIQNSTIKNIIPREDGDGIVVTSGTTRNNGIIANIQNNYFEDNAKRAIKIMSDRVNISGNRIVNNYPGTKSDWSDGMYSAISVYNEDVKISGNIITGTSYYTPIDVEGENIKNIVIEQNTIIVGENNTVLPYKGYITLTGNISKFTIENNIIGISYSDRYIRKRMNICGISFSNMVAEDIRTEYILTQ